MGLDINNSVVDNLLAFLPEVLCAFHVNLTGDVCIGRNGSRDIMRWLEQTVTFEQLREKLSESVLEGEYRDRYFTYINREYLLKLFEEGVHEKFLDVQCRVTTGEIHWVRITARLLRNEETGEVECLIYAVDVNDVIRKGIENSNLEGSLSNVYFSSHYINLTEDTFKELKAPEYIHNLLGSQGNAGEAMATLVESIVADQSLEKMRKFSDLTTIKERLNNQSHVEQDFLTTDNRYCRASCIKVLQEDDGCASCMFFVLQCIDDMVQREREKKLQDAVIAALSRDYFSIYYMNLDKNSFVLLRSENVRRPNLYNISETAQSYSDALQQFSQDFVCEEDREFFLKMTDAEYIKRRLTEEESFMFRYRVSPPGMEYFEVRLVRGEADVDGMHAIMGVRDVDVEMKKELEHQEKLVNAYRRVRLNLSQEEQYRRAIVSGALLVYNVNVSKDLLENDIYVMKDGETVSMLDMIGLEAPCQASAFYERFASKKVEEEYRQTFLEGTDIKGLRTAFARGENEQVQEFVADFEEGKRIIVRQTMLLFKDVSSGDIIVLCNCKDITEAKEKELKTQQALKDAFESAMLANQAKSDFLSRMSHDIRTPMNAIIGMTAIAGSHLDDRARVKDSLTKISASSRHLLGIINDILDMSKIESGKIILNKEDFNLSELLTNLLDMVRPQVKERGHELKVHIHDIQHEDVVGDSLRIQQAFVNIMSNAIKYTPEGGIIIVSVTEKPTAKSNIACYEFIFEDNGIGMSQEFLDRLFEPFERAEDLRTSKIQGTGLGMAITKNIVNMMGGQIQVESEIGKGSKFVITIFLQIQDGVAINTEPLAGLPILVADDDKIACENTSVMLDDIGMKSEWVLSGREAVEKVEEHHRAGDDYFAVIVDWKMPGMNGIETTKAIRKIVGDDMPIIIISVYDWSDIEMEARLAGVNAFISKPAFRSNLAKLFLGLLDSPEDGEVVDDMLDIGDFDFSDLRVLLVEDNDLNREIAVEILRETGLQVEEAENGKQAVDMFEKMPERYYDLILMDIQMPVMNGYDATVAIRSLGKGDSKRIPIIAMTANAFAEDVNAAISVGMNEHIAKPLVLKRMMECIQRWTRG